MHAQRVKRLFAVSAAGALMAGGVALGTAGTASAAAPTHSVSYVTGGDCGDDDDGWGGHRGGWSHNSGWDDDDDDYGYGGHGHGHHGHDKY
ncbi:hypothetical protein ACFWUW_33490 [Streptomyces sp. NPDC058655]|uniref:hypothetical protein n=1 Tax=unclassified Streptomyces TaxID=2593676 RepID=UPI0036538882